MSHFVDNRRIRHIRYTRRTGRYFYKKPLVPAPCIPYGVFVACYHWSYAAFISFIFCSELFIAGIRYQGDISSQDYGIFF
jgi:hypothetical protein